MGRLLAPQTGDVLCNITDGSLAGEHTASDGGGSRERLYQCVRVITDIHVKATAWHSCCERILLRCVFEWSPTSLCGMCVYASVLRWLDGDSFTVSAASVGWDRSGRTCTSVCE